MERRLSAILAADVVGYSRLCSADYGDSALFRYTILEGIEVEARRTRPRRLCAKNDSAAGDNQTRRHRGRDENIHGWPNLLPFLTKTSSHLLRLVSLPGALRLCRDFFAILPLQKKKYC
jgi:hypothetical protein